VDAKVRKSNQLLSCLTVDPLTPFFTIVDDSHDTISYVPQRIFSSPPLSLAQTRGWPSVHFPHTLAGLFPWPFPQVFSPPPPLQLITYAVRASLPLFHFVALDQTSQWIPQGYYFLFGTMGIQRMTPSFCHRFPNYIILSPLICTIV